jgi:cob(I)alamin adenosyltransferase
MKIYTKTGDKGTTSLLNGLRIPKHHIQVEAYGTVDEACSYIGVIIAGIQSSECKIQKDTVKITPHLIAVQKDLFQIEALLSEKGETQFPQFIDSLKQRTIALEKEIDAMTIQIPELKNFILPGGTLIAAQLQFARTIIRRAERSVAALMQEEKIIEEIIMYLNRLSDYLFTMGRFVNYLEKQEEVLWSR